MTTVAGTQLSRIERFLTPGVYLIEATTYLERDLQPLHADFTFVIQMVDEEARQSNFQLKVEATHAPDEVIAGEPFLVDYRIGNPGGGDLVDTDGSVVVYVVAPGVYQQNDSVIASGERWPAGASYHSGAQTASVTSVAIGEVKPFSVTFRNPGPSWVFVAIIAYDESGEEVGFHGIWRNLVVLSGFVFDPIKVNVDGLGCQVSAVADEEGEVTTTVTSGITPDAEVPRSTEAKALYTAGVLTQRLDPHLRTPGCSRSADHGRRGGDQCGESFVERLDEDLWTTVLKSCPGFRDEDISAGRSVGKSGGGRGTSSGDGGNCVGPGSLHRSDVEGAAKPNRGRVAHLLQ